MNGDVIKLDKKILQQLPFAETFRIKRDVIVSLDEDFDSFINNEIRVRLEKFEIAEHLADSYYRERAYFEFPTSTWQMFKQTNQDKWWLRWLIKHRPVITKYYTETVTIEVGRYVLYPDAPDIRFPKLGRPVKYETIKRVYKD